MFICKESELQAVSKPLPSINVGNVSSDKNSSRNDSDELVQENLDDLESAESEAVPSVNNESKPSFWSMTNGDTACLEEQITKKCTTWPQNWAEHFLKSLHCYMKATKKTGNPANLCPMGGNFTCPKERQMIHSVKEWDLLLLETILIDPSKIIHGTDLLMVPKILSWKMCWESWMCNIECCSEMITFCGT